VDRVCNNALPGPVSSTTSPSPLSIVDFNPPILLTTKPRVSSKATKWPVSTICFSPAARLIS